MIGNACHASTWERLRQEDCKFEASMDNLTQPCLKNNRKVGEGWGVCGSMLGCLPGMQEVLGAAPSIAKKKLNKYRNTPNTLIINHFQTGETPECVCCCRKQNGEP